MGDYDGRELHRDHDPRAELELKHPVAEVALLCGTTLVLLAFCTEAVAVAGLAIGFGMGWATFPIGVLAATAGSILTARWSRSTRRSTSRALVGAALVVAGAYGISGLLHDSSYDGQWYHQPAVMAISRGWNPLAGPLGGAPGRAAILVGYSSPKDPSTAMMCVNHYAKGPWYRAAALVLSGARMEQAKAFNFILAAASGLLALAVVLSVRCWSVGRSAWIATLVVLNPVVASQAFTFYVDGQLGAQLAVLVASAALAISASHRAAVVAFAAAIALAISTKFNGAAYAVVLAVASCALGVVWRGRRIGHALAGASLIAAIVSGIGLGWNPYVTNFITQGHPLHPFAGPHRIDNLSMNLPPGFAPLNRFERLARSVLAPSDVFWAGTGTPKPKLPSSVSVEEFRAFFAPDVRMGGFGPLFGVVLALGALLGIASAIRLGRAAAPAIWAALVLLGSVWITSEGWWARFAPQLWLVPLVLALLPTSRAGRHRWALSTAVLALVSLNAVAVLGFNMKARIQQERAIRSELRTVSVLPQGIELKVKYFEAVRYRLADAGVRFVVVDELRCAEPHRLARSDALWCPAPP